MVLTIDIGNTDTVLGIFSSSGSVDKTLRFPTVRTASAAELTQAIAALVGEKFVYIVASSVVPELVARWQEVLQENFKKAANIYFVNETSPWGFQIGVKEPARVGQDRLCNMEAALRYGRDAIVVDAGTATKFDVLKGGVFLGGAIAPGLLTSFRSLIGNTAQLKDVQFDGAIPAVGKNTEEALRSGAVQYFVAAVDGMLAKILGEERLVANAPVIVTGGLSVHLRARLKHDVHFSTNHTLEGLYAISQKL